MSFPAGWPPVANASGVRSIRVYWTGTATAAFDDNAKLFKDVTGAWTGPGSPNSIWAHSILIRNLGAGSLEFSFDGTNVHGKVLTLTERLFRFRYEAGISIRGVGGATPGFEVEAW